MQETGYVFKTSLKPLLHVPQFCLNPVILLELQIKKKIPGSTTKTDWEEFIGKSIGMCTSSSTIHISDIFDVCFHMSSS